MRFLVLADETIPQTEMDEVIKQYKELFKNTDLQVSFDIHREDMSDLPFQEYYDNNRGIQREYIMDRAAAIKQRYARRFDHILFWVAAENWIPAEDRIWGWCLGSMSGYEIIQCRFDTHARTKTARIANTLGTLWHEVAHTFDSFVYRLTGKHVEEVLNIERDLYDEIAVHGEKEGDQYYYIRYKENREIIGKISHLLYEAQQKRLKQHTLHVSILERLLEAYRSLLKAIQKGNKSV